MSVNRFLNFVFISLALFSFKALSQSIETEDLTPLKYTAQLKESKSDTPQDNSIITRDLPPIGSTPEETTNSTALEFQAEESVVFDSLLLKLLDKRVRDLFQLRDQGLEAYRQQHTQSLKIQELEERVRLLEEEPNLGDFSFDEIDFFITKEGQEDLGDIKTVDFLKHVIEKGKEVYAIIDAEIDKLKEEADPFALILCNYQSYATNPHQLDCLPASQMDNLERPHDFFIDLDTEKWNEIKDVIRSLESSELTELIKLTLDTSQQIIVKDLEDSIQEAFFKFYQENLTNYDALKYFWSQASFYRWLYSTVKYSIEKEDEIFTWEKVINNLENQETQIQEASNQLSQMRQEQLSYDWFAVYEQTYLEYFKEIEEIKNSAPSTFKISGLEEGYAMCLLEALEKEDLESWDACLKTYN